MRKLKIQKIECELLLKHYKFCTEDTILHKGAIGKEFVSGANSGFANIISYMK